MEKLGESIDKLMTIDISARGTIDKLYSAARSLSDKPLSLAAAEKLQELLQQGDRVFIVTGIVMRPNIKPSIAETDGPPGSVVLARALFHAFKAIPVIVTDEPLAPVISSALQVVGLNVVSLSGALEAVQAKGYPSVALVEPISEGLQPEKLKEKFDKIIEKYRPKVAISIERSSVNDKGFVHNMSGRSFTGRTLMDGLFEMAKGSGVFTIGIGDGGNEIGMGNIKETVQEFVPFGKKCVCHCGGGIAAATKTDLLLPATVSNWGGYAISAMVSAITNKPNVLHTGEMEIRILDKLAQEGCIDGILGINEIYVDGLPGKIHAHLIELMKITVEKGMPK